MQEDKNKLSDGKLDRKKKEKRRDGGLEVPDELDLTAEKLPVEQKKAPQPKEAATSEMVEKVIAINRVTKVTKGGKKLSFSALVVVGDGKGQVGFCLGKANEVAIAIRKALVGAKKAMIRVPLKEATITHQVNGVCGGAVVMLKPASQGTGVIAAGPVRAVCDSAGIHNILTKCHRSNNPINVVKATIDGLMRLKESPSGNNGGQS
jgi:small subunit ribosomal protein S5